MTRTIDGFIHGEFMRKCYILIGGEYRLYNCSDAYVQNRSNRGDMLMIR